MRKSKITSNQSHRSAAEERYEVFVIEDYEDKAGDDKSSWTRIGAAWPHKDGKGFNAELRALPLSGKIVLRRFEPQA